MLTYCGFTLHFLMTRETVHTSVCLSAILILLLMEASPTSLLRPRSPLDGHQSPSGFLTTSLRPAASTHPTLSQWRSPTRLHPRCWRLRPSSRSEQKHCRAPHSSLSITFYVRFVSQSYRLCLQNTARIQPRFIKPSAPPSCKLPSCLIGSSELPPEWCPG